MHETERHLFVCDCGSTEHQLIVSYFPDDFDEDFTYVSVHLTHKSFWKRLISGVKYILGRQSKYGAFEEILMTPEQCAQLASVMQQRSLAKVPNARN